VRAVSLRLHASLRLSRRDRRDDVSVPVAIDGLWIRRDGCNRLFNVLGIPVVAGRRFTQQEDANALPAVIVSEAVAGTEITCGRVGDSR